ncbi:MAG: hypothetical protein R2681_09060 [Pyrinomonadaceae bacterium]
MKTKRLLALLVFMVLLIQPIAIFSFETDQYNLPPVPLGDIGDEVTDYSEQALVKAVDKINEKIAHLEACLVKDSKESGCDSTKETKKDLTYYRSEDAVAKEVFKKLGDGIIPFTKAGSWLESHEFKVQPARYKTGFSESIHFTAPMNYLTISPTINMYGAEFGTDKIAHLFQQGYDYYSRYRRYLKKGASDEKAVRKAIKWGQKTERTYYGTLVSAVYSNADLAANYAGLKFYQGLTHDVKIGENVRPAVLKFENGKWEMNHKAEISENLLKPFISIHFNEAYNPSKIFNIADFRTRVRHVVRDRSCKQWFERYPGLSKEKLESTTKSLELWYGEDYGFSYSRNFVTIANTCFEK